MVWLSAIRHSRSAEQHSKSVEWHSLVTKWHAAPRSNTYAIPCSFMFSCNFLRSFDTQKDFFKSNRDILTSLAHLFSKNHHLHHCSQKVINSSFLKTHGFMFQTRGIRPRLMHFQKKKNHHHFLKKKKNQNQNHITIFKNHAFILN